MRIKKITMEIRKYLELSNKITIKSNIVPKTTPKPQREIHRLQCIFKKQGRLRINKLCRAQVYGFVSKEERC